MNYFSMNDRDLVLWEQPVEHVTMWTSPAGLAMWKSVKEGM